MMSTSHAIFDPNVVLSRRARFFGLAGADFLLERVAEDMDDRLSAVLRRFGAVADLGTPSEVLRERLRPRVDGAIAALEPDPRLVGSRPVPVALADLESGDFGEGRFDLVVSGLMLHSVNDLPGLFVRVRRALQPDGLFMAAFLGGESLTELRQSFASAEARVSGGVSPHVAPFVDVRGLGGLLQRAGFALPVVDVDRVVVRYDNALALMRDVRAMGLGNALVERSRKPMRRELALAVAEDYAAQFSDQDGRVRATFDIVWLSGWVPHARQQQPLKPGSAKVNLRDVLKPREG